MASMLYTLYKNDGSGESKEFTFEPGSTFPDAAILFNESTLEFVEWNESADGTSTSYFIDDMIPDMGDYYAIWETPDPVPYIATDQELKSIANAIRTKGNTSAQLQFPTGFVSAIEAISTGITPTGTKQITITQNGTTTEDVTNYANAAITVEAEGGSSADVNFYDYDGNLVRGYTADEFSALTELPLNPSHEGLIAQGWNWNLADAKAYVATYGKLDIGQMYITDDGKTRIYIHLEEGRLSPQLGVGVNGTVVVDWGDDSETVTLTGTSVNTVKWTGNHDYAEPGDYVITLAITGRASLTGVANTSAGSNLLRHLSGANNINYVYRSAIRRIEIGSNINILNTGALYSCSNLSTITIPNSVTSIGNSAFCNCLSLLSIVIPSSITSISPYLFQYCYSLSKVIIPNGVTSIGASAFHTCYSLNSMIIPSSVTTINASAFYSCSSLSSVIIPSGVASIPSSVFYACYSLVDIIIPDGVTYINSSVFNGCRSLLKINIPIGVTAVNNSTFANCYCLSSITIPSNVTSIGSNVFQNCYSLGFIRFMGSTPPTVSGIGTWSNVPTGCKIYVPAGSLSAYTSATNYPNSSTYTYVEY